VNIQVSEDSFEDMVRAAVAVLPDQFLSKLDNVSIIVADRPTREQMVENNLDPRDSLYGLYEGVPLPERGNFVPALPDLITIFQEPIEKACSSIAELELQVQDTVLHEVAHYFGFTDSELQQLGLG
jgi:predicted Zn-dependent protease with MMP-like domain